MALVDTLSKSKTLTFIVLPNEIRMFAGKVLKRTNSALLILHTGTDSGLPSLLAVASILIWIGLL